MRALSGVGWGTSLIRCGLHPEQSLPVSKNGCRGCRGQAGVRRNGRRIMCVFVWRCARAQGHVWVYMCV